LERLRDKKGGGDFKDIICFTFLSITLRQKVLTLKTPPEMLKDGQ
jgi:hypothetical protein